MSRDILRRLIAIVPIMFAVATATFFLLSLSGVNPAAQLLGPTATSAQVHTKEVALGTNAPLLSQYGHWLVRAIHGDLGSSYYTGVSVSKSITQRLPVTLSLLGGGLLIAIVLGVPAGVLAAVRRGRLADRLIAAFAAISLAIPGFWLGLLLVILFAVRLGWFPAIGYTAPSSDIAGWLKSMTLPSIALGFAGSAAFARQARAAMIGVLDQDYIRAAIARGLPMHRILFKHALVNASIPLVTLGAFQASTLLGGSIIVERVFTLPGLGTMAVDAAVKNDVPNMLGFVLVAALIVIAVNVLMDMAYLRLNPKMRAA